MQLMLPTESPPTSHGISTGERAGWRAFESLGGIGAQIREKSSCGQAGWFSVVLGINPWHSKRECRLTFQVRAIQKCQPQR